LLKVQEHITDKGIAMWINKNEMVGEKDTYMVEYNHPSDPKSFYGASKEEALSKAMGHDPDGRPIMQIWVWTGEFYQPI